jgi:hypothetical protein
MLPIRRLPGDLKMKFTRSTLTLFAAISLFAPLAHAYLDLGTGSMVLQALLGGVAGLVVIGRLYWNRFLAFFRRGKVEGDDA